MQIGWTVPHSLAPADGAVRSKRRVAAAILLIAMLSLEMLSLLTGVAIAAYAAWTAMLLYWVAAADLYTARERIILAICAAASAALIYNGRWDALGRSLDQAAFLASFISMMGLLREAAARSPAVLTCGVYLTMQPPQRRYFATHLGGHGMGVLVNFGAISLLAPLIQRGVNASGAPPDIALIRERRQLTALIRGFSWMVVWAPTSVTQALLATAIAGVQLHGLLLYGLLTSLLMLGVGWSEDRLHWRGLAKRVRADGWKASLPPPFPRRAFLSLAGVSSAIIASVIIFHWLFGVPTTHALMITAPLTLIVWLIAQGGTAHLRANTRGILLDALPNGGREIIMLGASGFLGIAAAALVPAGPIAELIGGWGLSPAMFLIALPIIVVAAGQVAISPIMVVVFLAAVIGAFPVPLADPTLTALSLSCGWALSMTASPNASGAIMLARITARSSYQLTWEWNFAYNLLALAVLAILFAVFTKLPIMG